MQARKIMRRIIGSAAALVVVLTAAALGLMLTGGLDRFKPNLVERLSRVLGRPVSLKGDLEIVWAFPPGLSVNGAHVANADWSEPAHMAEISRIDVIPDWKSLLGGRFRPARIVAHGARLNLARKASGDWNLPQPASSGSDSRKTSLRASDLPTVELKDSRIRLVTPRRAHDIQVDALRLAFGAEDDHVRLACRVHFREKPLSIDAALSPIGALLSPETPGRITVRLKTGPNRFTAEGTLALFAMPRQLDLTFDLNAPEPAGLPFADFLPRGFANSLRASGRLHSTDHDERYRISDLRLETADSDAEGWIALVPLADPVYVSADLRSQKADLRPFLKADAPAGRQTGPDASKGASSDRASGSASDRLFSTEPFDLKALANLHLEVQATVATFLLPRLALQNLKATVRLKDGRLDLEPVVADVGGGSLEGRFHLVAGEMPEIRSQSKIKRLDLADMLETLGLPPSLQGDLGVQFDLSGRGASPADLAGSLDGRFSLAMQEGRVARRYLQKAGAYGFELTDAFVKLLQPEQKEASTYVNVDCAVARFVVEEGVAESNVLVFDTARAGVVGDGRVDLREERLNIALKPITEGGLGIPGVVKLKVGTTVADAFKLGGTLKSPRISLDKSESALSLGKALGGMLLFGPAGLTAGLLEAEFGGNNPCVKALEEAETIQTQGNQ